MTRIGVVAIGRNEGERLIDCLDSARPAEGTLIYVDSGSSDGSVAAARARGVQVVELDLKLPFTAARARNSGFARLLEIDPQVEWVQFVDGDCEIVQGWWQAARARLPASERSAVICGRRRERYPRATVYNLLCDIEWNTPVGPALACGGDSLVRVAALRAVGGFNPALIAGEEPELCFRLRKAGYTIERIPSEMTLHDAAMTRFSQWWRRGMRAGHAYAENFSLHGASPEGFKRRELRSILAWAGALPAFALGLAPATRGLSLLGLAAYLLLFARVRHAAVRAAVATSDANRFAAFAVLGKFAQLAGVIWFHWNRARGRRARLIEYKDAA